MAHGAHFLCEARVMVEIQIGTARSGAPFRYIGRRAIFLTQTLGAAGIWIFSTQTFGVLVLRWTGGWGGKKEGETCDDKCKT